MSIQQWLEGIQILCMSIQQWLEGIQILCMSIQQFPTEDWSTHPTSKDWLAASTAQATEWVETTTELS
jgi:hypothetical protein